jgi:hypothetical protein
MSSGHLVKPERKRRVPSCDVITLVALKLLSRRSPSFAPLLLCRPHALLQPQGRGLFIPLASCLKCGCASLPESAASNPAPLWTRSCFLLTRQLGRIGNGACNAITAARGAEHGARKGTRALSMERKACANFGAECPQTISKRQEQE